MHVFRIPQWAAITWHQLAVDMLAIFVQRRGIEVPPGPFANPSEALREYCFALTRH